MPTFHVRGTIEVPFECEVTASGYREAVAYVKTRSVADVFDEHVGSGVIWLDSRHLVGTETYSRHLAARLRHRAVAHTDTGSSGVGGLTNRHPPPPGRHPSPAESRHPPKSSSSPNRPIPWGSRSWLAMA